MDIKELDTESMKASCIEMVPTVGADVFKCEMQAIGLAVRIGCSVRFKYQGKTYLVCITDLQKATQVFKD